MNNVSHSMRQRNVNAVILATVSCCATLIHAYPNLPQANTNLSADRQALSIIHRLSLAEKIGQLVQAEILDIKQAVSQGQHPVRDLNLGSLVAGGNSIIAPNTPASWRQELDRLKAEALAGSAHLPLLVGVDAVHGQGLVRGATLFPHNIGLGAAHNPELMHDIGTVVAREVLATGFNWTFAPAVTVARDIRWGRTYESFGESPELQRILVQPYIRGMHGGDEGQSGYLATSAKHFLGDGGTLWGTGFPSETSGSPQIDRGDTRGEVHELIALHGQGYEEALAADVDTVMASYNSINGLKMHAHRPLLTDYLKKSKDQGGLGFEGFVISDWNAVDELVTPAAENPLKHYQLQLVKAVDAGVDMIMVAGKLPLADGKEDHEFRFVRTHQLLLDAVKRGLLSESRIDDAVRRILRIKIKSGLFKPTPDNTHSDSQSIQSQFGSQAHREIARAAVRSSLVLLKNAHGALPIGRGKYQKICVAGTKADDFGVQSGAWTLGWQGNIGNQLKPEGAMTILDGLKSLAQARGIPLEYSPSGFFQSRECLQQAGTLTLAVAGENPYAEFKGDQKDLSLSAEDLQMLDQVQKNKATLAVILISGRPLIISQQLSSWDALVAAWLPGSQGEGVADVLFGDFDFTGRLPQTWPRSMDQLPFGPQRDQGLFPYFFGLSYVDRK